MLLSVLTLTQPLPKRNKQQEGCKALVSTTSIYLEALGGVGGREKRKKAEIKRHTFFFFKYIKMDTIGLYIHIHLTKPGE